MESAYEKFTEPKFIVKEYTSNEKMKDKILHGSYLSTDKVVPMLRDRGTKIERAEDGTIHIMGWQKDITRMRKQDVELSFIVYVDISKEGKVLSADIDKSFNGGKGLLCSREFLQDNLNKLLVGEEFVPKIATKFRLSKFKCFHIHEIMNSIYTTYFLFIENHVGDGKSFYEEDINDWYACDGNLYLTAAQCYKGRETLHYAMSFMELFDHVTFDSAGYMWIKDEIEVNFYMNNKLILKEQVNQYEDDYMFMKLQKFLFECLIQMQEELAPNYKKKIMNTNLYASAIIGSLMQAVGIRILANNFNYIQYIMTAMQRPLKKPGCLGAILNKEEADQYFEGFNIDAISS